MRQTQKNPSIAWIFIMEPSGLEPLPPCMPCSVLQGLDSLRSNGPVVILNRDFMVLEPEDAENIYVQPATLLDL